MSLAVIHSRACFGINAPLVTVEVHLSNGLPSMSVVGLASAEVKESKERVRSALLNSNFEFPASRIIINLGPADLPKSSGRFDLPIALGILIASKQIDIKNLDEFEVIGELSLSGELRPVNGALMATLAAMAEGKEILLPEENAEEATLSGTKNVYCATTLLQLCQGLKNKVLLKYSGKSITQESIDDILDIAEVRGNQHAKRALLIAAAGSHNLLFSGSPGSGKTMLAKCLPGLLDKMDVDDAMDVAAIESVAKVKISEANWLSRRFRSPHHNCSVAAVTGGGRLPVPGEISLAHKGILFFDELPEFTRKVLESLRQPLEDGQLTISRAEWKVDFPASFQFIAAMNPCPCGFFTSEDRDCHCTKTRIMQYLGRLSGPLLDRIDIQVMVNNPRVSLVEMPKLEKENSHFFREKIKLSREKQIQRQGVLNSQLSTEVLLEISHLGKAGKKAFNKVIKHHQLSIRAQQKVLRVARTIADLDEQTEITEHDIIEAASFRAYDQLLTKVRDFI
ncbi:MAG: YifB family Mg chelatase-like AAA ATPase [Gammaproteobacteria bacterium]|nr:YifB family Mg chelatase-like AAA ATPase [Gammaproteobacteria bacterium]